MLLAAYPGLQAAYTNEPPALDMYGLPVPVREYGAFVAVCLQRATLQLWRDPAGPRRAIGNAADIAKDAALWPAAAVSPALPDDSAD
jgi:hypothetical protein